MSEPLQPIPGPHSEPRFPRRQTLARTLRIPWTLRIAGICWAVAGVIFALTPLVAALLLRSQYVSLRGNAFRIAGLADRLTPEEFVRLEPYLADFERIETFVTDASGWAVLPLVLLYAAFACAALFCYLPLSIATARGVRWARVFATVMAALGCVVVFVLWQAFAAISWLPVTALSANHLGLVLLALHIAGIVFAWLPASNAYARARGARPVQPIMV